MSGRSGDACNCVSQFLDHTFDKVAVIALSHDTNERFGAGSAHNQPTMASQTSFCIGDQSFDRIVFKRLSAAMPNTA